MNTTPQQFDFIIVGAGCSGLSLAMRILSTSALRQKKMLLVDKDENTANQKTWCFWDKGNIAANWNEAGIIHKEWADLWIKHPTGNIKPQIGSYSYKMIRSREFVDYCLKALNTSPNVFFCYEAVTAIDAAAGTISTTKHNFNAPHIFSSVLFQPPALTKKDVYILQHFRGWWIETVDDEFDDSAADLMNFNTSQAKGCAFFYVLPVTKRRALVEYTLFSEKKLAHDEYNAGLTAFIRDELKISHYRIVEEEQGIIPMTDLTFPRQQGKMIFIGTAGGQTKASTGYTFSFIQKQSEAIVRALVENENPGEYTQPARFHFYDSVLLKILAVHREKGADIFFRMFKKNEGTMILKFLDNETNFLEELFIMNSTEKRLFIPVAVRKLLGGG